MADAPTTKRAQARVAMTADIKRVARLHLAEHGADGLSLRAVARDPGVVSSAVYRYVSSRHELLTLLIIDAYDAVGEAAEAAAADRRGGFEARWIRTTSAVRRWAVDHPHDYALVYGSPVPGYAAPADTIGPASRPVYLFVTILRDGVDRGVLAPSDRLPKAVRQDLEGIAGSLEFAGLPPAVLARGMTAWAQLFGSLSFELFGRLTNGVHDFDAYFDHQLRAMAAYVGLS